MDKQEGLLNQGLKRKETIDITVYSEYGAF